MGKEILEMMKGLTGGCFHEHVSWPQHNRQRCLECGEWRSYDLQSGVRGEWNAPERPDPAAEATDAQAAAAWDSWHNALDQQR